MASSQLHHRRRRAEEGFFDSKNFYLMLNLRTAANHFRIDSNDDPGVIGPPMSDSENWQFFFQDGFYYIRNYHWGPSLQLGLTTSSKINPQMHARSADPGQQWVIRQLGNTKFVMVNQLLGPSANFSVPNNEVVPGMFGSIGGEVWNITINESAARLQPIKDDSGWLSPVTSTSAISPTISSQSTPTASPLSTASSSLLSSILSSSSPSSSAPPSSSASSDPSLTGGAIAGIAIGGVALLGALALVLWFILARRRKARVAPAYNPHAQYMQAPPPRAPVSEKYAHRSELPSPPAELATVEHRSAELGSWGQR